jgi:hypothetical protein
MSAVDGAVSYTGVGFKPDGIIFTGEWDFNSINIGMTDGSNQRSHMHFGSNNNYCSADRSIFITSADDTKTQFANIDSFDDDGFTLGWYKMGSGTGIARINYMAFKTS